ncbi:MAG: AzlC family ABC transporter permease [Clostridia bacterium]|nr:AzlC family ABC transporter permease [Clostridia bacterium]
MRTNVFKTAFPRTLPVLAGYLSLGIAFGILLSEAGYGMPYALMMSVLIFAGSAQFLCVELLLAEASLPQTALLVLLLNFRHFFYGLTMISRYRGRKRKWYLIFGLTDETYALLSADSIPDGVNTDDFYFAVTLLDHLYWIAGSVIGSLVGTMIPFDMAGIDFAMTALFAVLVVEQWRAHKRHFPALLGFGVAILALRIFGAESFIIPTLTVVCAVLLLCRKRLEGDV